MPSDAKKKRDAKKKEAAKARGKPKSQQKKEETNGTNGTDTPPLQLNDEELGACAANGHTDSLTDTTEELVASANQKTYGSADDSINSLVHQLAKHDLLAAEARNCTGVLGSHPDARDLQVIQFSLSFYGAELLVDTKLELNTGRRYGLIGPNGCGKSTLLSAIANRELPIPEHFDMFHLRREVPASEKTALRCVIEVDEERARLEAEADEIAHLDSTEAQERLMDIYERLDDLEADKAEMKAGRILSGLGFTREMQFTAAKNFSGGWRMRIALARALYIQPTILLLDEPTNHLDLEACVWLEAELKKYKRVLVLISHSQDFMNGVCTNIIHMHKLQLKYYTGNYDQYIQTRFELEENQMKQYKWEQSQIQHMKTYIARFGHGSAKLARQAQSKEKTLKKMVDKGLAEKVESDKTLTFYFYACGHIPPPAIMVQHVAFRYKPDSELIYKDLDFGIDMDTRVALVGPNGAGKSTLLKLICGELTPTDGMVRRNPHLKIGRYHQHLQEILNMEMSALQWFRKEFPEIKEVEEMRKMLGRYGLTGNQQVCAIRQLSDGQRCRIMFAWLAYQTPHLLLLDEPTNHLDIETIDSLAEAINDFEGAMILVSHDFRLINQVADTIWECNHQCITPWEGDIYSYKQHLLKRVNKQMKKFDAQF